MTSSELMTSVLYAARNEAKSRLRASLVLAQPHPSQACPGLGPCLGLAVIRSRGAHGQGGGVSEGGDTGAQGGDAQSLGGGAWRAWVRVPNQIYYTSFPCSKFLGDAKYGTP